MSNKILIVDDEESLCRQLGLRLENKGFNIEIAKDGEIAMEKYYNSIDSEPYSVIFLDLMMPKKSGREVLDEIRAYEEEKELPDNKKTSIIILTALSVPWLINHDEKYTGYIIKPYDFEEILETIKIMIEIKQEL